MASVHKRPKSKFFHAAYTDGDGSRRLRSTGETDRRKAQKIADMYEKAGQLARQKLLTAKRARDVINAIYHIANGETLPADQGADCASAANRTSSAVVTGLRMNAVAQCGGTFAGDELSQGSVAIASRGHS